MRILLADDEPGRCKALGDTFAGRGHIVDRAVHGAAALELALERVPGIVVCPVDLPIIDGVRLAEILRGNPRTRGATFVFLVEDELDAPVAMDVRDRVVAFPWAQRDVLRQIDSIFQQEARFPEENAESGIEGEIAQISLIDLMQVLHQNRRSGRLRVEGGLPGASGREAVGTIEIDAGQMVTASVGSEGGACLTGEKALFRLLSWREGRFEFAPGEVDTHSQIERPTRALLLEGVRQLDEWERLRAELPPPDASCRLEVVTDRLPRQLHPLWREVLDAIALDPSIQRVVDACPSPDYQVLRALHDLMARGAVAVESPVQGQHVQGEPQGDEPLTPLQLRHLRDWMDAQRTRPGPVLKVPVLVSSPAALARLRDALSGWQGFGRRHADLATEDPPPFGTLGDLRLGEGLALRFWSVPPGAEFAPLRDVAAHGALGSLVVLDEPLGEACSRVADAAATLASGSGRPLVCIVTGGVEELHEGRCSSGVASLDAEPVLHLDPGQLGEGGGVLRNALARLVP